MRISSLRDGNQLCAVNHVDLAGIVVTCKRARCKRYPGRATIMSRVDGVHLALI